MTTQNCIQEMNKPNAKNLTVTVFAQTEAHVG